MDCQLNKRLSSRTKSTFKLPRRLSWTYAMNDTTNLPKGCDAANAHLSQPIPSVLWHYTSFSALQGIVTSKAIWASEYRFLNDEEEFLHARKLAKSIIEEQFPDETDFTPPEVTLRKLVQGAFNSDMMNSERLRIMVASFSEVKDQLSQWRGYAAGSTGVSLGLDVRHLRAPAGISTMATLAPCIYEDSKKRALLSAIFVRYSKALREFEAEKEKVGITENEDKMLGYLLGGPKHLQDLLANICRELQYDLLRISPLLKNESFSEEREWRLVFPVESIFLPANRKIEFRATSDSIVPYVAYSLLVHNQTGPIPLYQVTVGPGAHPSAILGVTMFLNRNEIPIQAEPSAVPYRPK